MDNNVSTINTLPSKPWYAKKRVMILLISLLGLFIIGSAAGAYYLVNGPQRNDDSIGVSQTPNPTKTQTPSISSTNIPDSSITPSSDKYDGWKVYYISKLDITLKYPSTFSIKEIEQIGTECELVREDLRQPNECRDEIKEPTIVLSNQNGTMQLLGPRPYGWGGTCGEEYSDVNLNVKIVEQSYTYPIKKLQSGSYCSADSQVKIDYTGSKSSWNAFYVQINGMNEAFVNEAISILETIN
jgi:hypothetical protein